MRYRIALTLAAVAAISIVAVPAALESREKTERAAAIERHNFVIQMQVQRHLDTMTRAGTSVERAHWVLCNSAGGEHVRLLASAGVSCQNNRIVFR